MRTPELLTGIFIALHVARVEIKIQQQEISKIDPSCRKNQTTIAVEQTKKIVGSSLSGKTTKGTADIALIDNRIFARNRHLDAGYPVNIFIGIDRVTKVTLNLYRLKYRHGIGILSHNSASYQRYEQEQTNTKQSFHAPLPVWSSIMA
ncbi:MAG: hypothetical protein CVV42_03255 [Candidatus Riflebacteria bacterium HGW-Riflebacteria-2]|nr:MAG: hypothetical protein CVV42_03255 [Candidatus Riflebacteria bacterium HGW-Riflebacteria-2]